MSTGPWVVEYEHRHGTDVILCKTEEEAKITALDLFLDNWSDFEDRKEGPVLREEVKHLAQKIVAKDIDGAAALLVTIMSDDKYGYDESFVWYFRDFSDQATPLLDLVKNAINTIHLIEENEEANGQESK